MTTSDHITIKNRLQGGLPRFDLQVSQRSEDQFSEIDGGLIEIRQLVAASGGA